MKWFNRLPQVNPRLGLAFLAAVLFLSVLIPAAGGGTFSMGFEQTPGPIFSLTATVAAVSTENAHLAGQLASLLETPRPVPPLTPPTPSPPPSFSNLRFSTQAEALQPRRFFAAGIPRLYASWDFADMRDGMLVRRVWSYEGEEFRVGEELWDVAVYGTHGTIHGNSIFEDEGGLPAGEYSLSLYIEGVLQDVGTQDGMQPSLNFWLFPPDITAPVLSPDRARSASVQDAGRLFVEEPDGHQYVVAVAQEIPSLAWFPDSRRLLYAERDRTGQLNPEDDRGITHKLWIVDVETGERSLIAAAGENFHSPLVSPGGGYVAVLSGPLFRAGCQASPTLAVLELDLEYHRQAIYLMQDFELPPQAGLATEAYQDQAAAPLRWEGEGRLSAFLRWPCPPRGLRPDGTYRLDLLTLTATRVQ